MKLKSLLLGSVAAAGLSTSAFAADLSTVVSSFDVCEDLGISGTLQLASTDDCLQISGSIEYEFNWGDYAGNQPLTQGVVFDGARRTVMDNNSFLGNGGSIGIATATAAIVADPAAGTNARASSTVTVGATTGTILVDQNGAFLDENANGVRDTTEHGYVDADGDNVQDVNEPSLIFTGPGAAAAAANTNQNMDWSSKVETWVQFVGSAASEFGTAKAVIKLYNEDETTVVNEVVTAPAATATTPNNVVSLKEAYVSVGDGTSIVAGRRDTSVFKDDDDEPFGFIGLFHSDAVDEGVDVLKNHLPLKGHVIQLYHAVGDSGVTVSAGLENIDNSAAAAIVNVAPLAGGVAGVAAANAGGSLVGTIAYAAPDGSLTGHVSAGAGGVLDGTIEDWKMHAGFTGTFDTFKVRGAMAGGSSTVAGVTTTEWNGLVTGEATFDMFTLAAAFEAANYNRVAVDVTQWGASVTGSAAVTDQVTLQAGFRWYDSNTGAGNTETWQAALKLIAKLTDTLTATLEGGYYDTNFVGGANDVLYGSAEIEWKPGGSFETSIKGEVNSIGAYKATFKASKSFD